MVILSPSMDVYLIPTRPDRYVLYCEAHAAPVDPEALPRGWRARLVQSFRRAVAEGEEARDSPDTAHPQSRVRAAITRKLADAVAEQRLLWSLRRESTARLVHPDDLTAAAAMDIHRALLTGDRDRHRRWCVIDGAIVVCSAPLALLPGPNVLAYYFVFRSVGHFLSMQGAAQGLGRVSWSCEPSRDLSAVRTVRTASDPERTRGFERIADALGVPRLAMFLARITDPN